MGAVVLAVLALVAGVEGEFLTNGNFEAGLEGWAEEFASADVRAEVVERDGGGAVCLMVPDDAPVAFPALAQRVPAEPGMVFEVEAEARGMGVKDGYGAYAALEFHDGSGARVSFSQSPAAEEDWTALSFRAVAPPGTESARFCLLLNGHGKAHFDNVRLGVRGSVAVPPLTGPVTLTVSDEVVCDGLKGFGAEDDGWFYNEENGAKGVTEEDAKIREGRIRWMDPDWVRMFFWYKDWNPSGDWETFTFDSPNMESHYRTLDLYEELGACVNVVGVEWGLARPFGEWERMAKAIGALFEHLVKERGYRCVQEWTLTNEPNTHWTRWGNTFEEYVKLHTLVKAEFARRGLAIRVVGSDDTNGGWPWFEACVKSDAYFGAADLFVSHRYIPFADRSLARYLFEDAVGLLGEREERKPFLIAEFGFHDQRAGTLENPLMEEYAYAVWTAAFVIEGLNRGVAGFSIWCLSEVYYPGNGFMNYGLWNFKDRDWETRPVYHAFSLFSRLTEAGDRVYGCRSSSPGHVVGARVGDVLFWVNRSDEAAAVRLQGFEPKEVCVLAEGDLKGDRECGRVVHLEEPEFEAPGQSFGYAR